MSQVAAQHRHGCATIEYSAWECTCGLLYRTTTPMERGAKRAALAQPSIAEVRRATSALLDTSKPVCYARGEYRGWKFNVFDSPFRAGLLLVGASKPGEADLSEEVATLDEARRWVGRLTA